MKKLPDVEIGVINESPHPLPRYATEGSAGADICAWLPEGAARLAPGARALIPTGLRLELSRGWEAQLRPRSGLALRHGITLLNAPATIDADYRGEINVLLVNLGDAPFELIDGTRIAQMVFAQVAQARFVVRERLSETARGGGGFGHTGISP